MLEVLWSRGLLTGMGVGDQTKKVTTPKLKQEWYQTGRPGRSVLLKNEGTSFHAIRCSGMCQYRPWEVASEWMTLRWRLCCIHRAFSRVFGWTSNSTHQPTGNLSQPHHSIGNSFGNGKRPPPSANDIPNDGCRQVAQQRPESKKKRVNVSMNALGHVCAR